MAAKQSTSFDVQVTLTADEIAALRLACEHVRVHMAHQHTWKDRDAAMEAISKVLSAAREVTP